jgi:hypothetical protein
MKNLEQELKRVWSASTLQDKINAMSDLIEVSHAKKETKDKAIKQLLSIQVPRKIDVFAANYMMSGEGMGVK